MDLNKASAQRNYFYIPYNWDEKLLEAIKNFSKSGSIKLVYGRVSSSSTTGGGRAYCEVPDYVSKKIAEEHIKEIKKTGLDFNYLVNACTLDQEFTEKSKKEIFKEFEWLSEIGVSYVTISIPYLLKIIKKYFSQLKVNISVFAHISTPTKAKRWEDLGADSFCIDRSLTRQFSMLSKFSKTVNIEPHILVNDPCLFQCPYELYHDNLMARGSIYNKKDYYHYCSYLCQLDFINKPSEIIKSTFIRPEDLKYYRKVGINIFKIVDRNRSTEWIINAINAYLFEEYKGDLMDIMSLFSGLGCKSEQNSLPISKSSLNHPSKIDEAWQTIRGNLGLIVKNEKMEGFINHFTRSDCFDKLCGETCHYCEETASQALSINREKLQWAKKSIENVLDIIHMVKE